MKTSKYIVATLLSGMGILSLEAQGQDSTFDRNVTVEREYQPVIQDAGKINSTPGVLEQDTKKAAAVYSDFNLPLDAGFNIHTLPAAVPDNTRPLPEQGFARIGLGSYFNTMADFAYPLIDLPGTRLDFSLHHLGTFSDKIHSTTKANLYFDQHLGSAAFYAGITGSHEYLKYYGNNFNAANAVTDLHQLALSYPPAQYQEQDLVRITRTPQTLSIGSLAQDSLFETFWRWNFFAGIRSLPMENGLRYQAGFRYQIFDSRNGLSENMLQAKAGFSSQLEKNRAGIDVEMYRPMYHSSIPSLLNFWDTYTVFTMNPYYSIERPEWNVRLGLKAAFSFVHGNPFNPSPDISANWNIFPEYLSIYGGITGGYSVNTMYSMFTENPYLFPDVRVKDTYTPYDFYAGIRLKPIYNLLIDGFVDFKRISNQYFFVNKKYALISSALSLPAADSVLYTNRFNVIYSGANLTRIGVRASYNLRNRFDLQMKLTFNNWTVDTQPFAWNMPAFESELNATYRITRNLSVDANVFLDGERYAKLGNTAVRMNPKTDINLGVAYSYNNWFTAFAKVNNLINSSYQDYYGYDVQKFNVMAGAAFSF